MKDFPLLLSQARLRNPFLFVVCIQLVQTLYFTQPARQYQVLCQLGPLLMLLQPPTDIH